MSNLQEILNSGAWNSVDIVVLQLPTLCEISTQFLTQSISRTLGMYRGIGICILYENYTKTRTYKKINGVICWKVTFLRTTESYSHNYLYLINTYMIQIHHLLHLKFTEFKFILLNKLLISKSHLQPQKLLSNFHH